MKRLLLAGIIACTVILGAPAAWAQPGNSGSTFTANFSDVQQRNAPVTCPALFCGQGTVNGYGQATYEATVLSAPVPATNNCFTVDVGVHIVLTNGSGTLDLLFSALACTPGKSGTAPGALHSFGNPLRATGPFTTASATGVFAGVNATGTGSFKTAGAHSALNIQGNAS